MNNSNNDRKVLNEINHGKFIAEKGEEIWNWSSPAGKIRWKRRIDLFRDFIGNGNKNILEVGCGTGLFTKEIAGTNNRITAIDVSEELINIAKNRVTDQNVRFMIDNAYETSFENDTFDYIIGSSVLHHLEIDQALKEFYRILKPGGKLMFTEPNMMNPQIALQKNIGWLKKRMGDSPDETAFVRWVLYGKMEKTGYGSIGIAPFDFLHPSTPASLIPIVRPLLDILERTPLLKEIAGSLVITAMKQNLTR